MADLEAIAAAAPMRTYPAGAMLYLPHRPIEALFALKRGRVRIFRVSPDGRALTTAIMTPGTVFGEIVLIGRRMYDNFAEAGDLAGRGMIRLGRGRIAVLDPDALRTEAGDA